MKKALRLLIKILVTPVYIPLCVLVFTIGYAIIFALWLWDDYDTLDSYKEVSNDKLQHFKEWFTKI